MMRMIYTTIFNSLHEYGKGYSLPNIMYQITEVLMLQ